MKKIKNTKMFIIAIFWVFYLSLHMLLVGEVWVWNVTSIIPPVTYFGVSCILFVLVSTDLIKRTLKFKSINPMKLRISKVFPLTLFLIVVSCIISFPISDINIDALVRHNNVINKHGITIFNWNTQFWEPEETQDDLIAFLLEQKADIYNLQEFGLSVSMYKSEEELASFHKKQFQAIEAAFPEFNIYYQNDLITLSKFPIKEDETEEDVYWMKLNVEVNDSIISMYNVHIPVHFFGSDTPINDVRNKFELREHYFSSLESSVKENKNPYFISGDFNSTKAMGVMNPLLKMTSDSYSVSNRLLPATWQTGPFRLWRIDYCLISKDGLEFIEHEDVDPEGMSDHWGQRVIISY